ncbi:MAG: ATP-binding protein [Methanosarcina barkeri]|nr:ATP-binding protein [Methanosarcina sp. ERenArc_MAG2]
MNKKFFGREKELDEFNDFLIGMRPNNKGGKGAPLLVVVGDRGMGKTALLHAMAKQAYEQEHYVIPREVDERSNFHEQVYPLITILNEMIKEKSVFHG